jgi:hypothetical protein
MLTFHMIESTTVATPSLYCLLIGVDFYLPNKLPGGIVYPNLEGCVRDISQINAFLQHKLGVPPERIFVLKAFDSGEIHPPEPANSGRRTRTLSPPSSGS